MYVSVLEARHNTFGMVIIRGMCNELTLTEYGLFFFNLKRSLIVWNEKY